MALALCRALGLLCQCDGFLGSERARIVRLSVDMGSVVGPVLRARMAFAARWRGGKRGCRHTNERERI